MGLYHFTLCFVNYQFRLFSGIYNVSIRRLARRSSSFSVKIREFDTSFSIVKTRHIEITPLAVNFFVKFYDFVSACWCLL